VLFPREPKAQADVLRWLFWCSCHIDPYFTTLVVERLIKPRRGAPCDDAACAHAEQWLARFVPILGQQLTGREYVTGTFSIADIALGCTFEMSPLLRVDLGPFPNSARGSSACRLVIRGASERVSPHGRRDAVGLRFERSPLVLRR